jgi:hypothetical protein
MAIIVAQRGASGRSVQWFVGMLAARVMWSINSEPEVSFWETARRAVEISGSPP